MCEKTKTNKPRMDDEDGLSNARARDVDARLDRG